MAPGATALDRSAKASLAPLFGNRIAAIQLFLVICHTSPDISGLAAELRFPLRRAGPRIKATIRESRLLEGSSGFLELRPLAHSLVVKNCAVAWGMMQPMRVSVQQ